MKTVWLKLDLDTKGYVPDTEYRRLYFASQHRAGISDIQPGTEMETPSLTVTSLAEIPTALDRLSLKG